MQASAEAERLERLESDAIDVLASLWAVAHQEAVAEPDASASVVTATHPEVQSDHGSAPGESMEIEPAVHSAASAQSNTPTQPNPRVSKKASKRAIAQRRELRKAALKVIEKAKIDQPIAGLYNLKQGVDRVLQDLQDPEKPKMMSKSRLKMEIAAFTMMKKELSVLVPKRKLMFTGMPSITKVIRFTAGC